MYSVVKQFTYKGYRCMITEVKYKDTVRLGFDLNHEESLDYPNTADFVEKNLRAVADFITGKEMR